MNIEILSICLLVICRSSLVKYLFRSLDHFDEDCLFSYCYLRISLTSLVAQTVKHLPKMWDTQVQSLGQEDLLEKEMATHSSILAWKIPWTEELGRLQSLGSQSWTRLSNFTFFLSLLFLYQIYVFYIFPNSVPYFSSFLTVSFAKNTF